MNEVTIAFGPKKVIRLSCKIKHKRDCNVLQNHMKITLCLDKKEGQIT